MAHKYLQERRLPFAPGNGAGTSRPHSDSGNADQGASRLADPLTLSPLFLPDERRARARFDGGAALSRNRLVERSACRHITRRRRTVARASFLMMRFAPH